MIPKGTQVDITTTNGGAGTYVLTADYRPTFPAFLATEQGHEFVVDQFRLASITPVVDEADYFDQVEDPSRGTPDCCAWMAGEAGFGSACRACKAGYG